MKLVLSPGLSFLINSQQTFVLMKISWQGLEDVFRLRLQKTSWSRWIYLPKLYVFRRRLLIKTNIIVLVIHLQDVFKMPSRPLQDVLQDVFKTSCKNVFKTSSRRLQDVLKMSSRHLQDVFNTFWRLLQDVFKTSCKDLFKTFSKRMIKLNCSC